MTSASTSSSVQPLASSENRGSSNDNPTDTKSKKRKLNYDNDGNRLKDYLTDSPEDNHTLSRSDAPFHDETIAKTAKVPKTNDNDSLLHRPKFSHNDRGSVIQQLQSDLRKEEERLRKLSMVKMYREKNNLEELGVLIDKWRDVCQQSLQDLLELLPSPRPSFKELLDHLQIDYDLVHFDAESESFS